VLQSLLIEQAKHHRGIFLGMVGQAGRSATRRWSACFPEVQLNGRNCNRRPDQAPLPLSGGLAVVFGINLCEAGFPEWPARIPLEDNLGMTASSTASARSFRRQMPHKRVESVRGFKHSLKRFRSGSGPFQDDREASDVPRQLGWIVKMLS